MFYNKGPTMNQKLISAKHVANVYLHNFSEHWKINWHKYVVILFAGFIIYNKDLNFQLQLKNSNYSNLIPQLNTDSFFQKKAVSQLNNEGESILVSNKIKKDKSAINYIKNHFKLAQNEMNKYNIPASITLAQALLETNFGKSKLATNCNNHFGIKCFSKKCKKGHCMNFNDDTHKDFFMKYKSEKESYNAHSIFLQKDRYSNLFNLNKNDYKSWCYELKKAGYATDKKYPEKLIRLIENYELYKFDN